MRSVFGEPEFSVANEDENDDDLEDETDDVSP